MANEKNIETHALKAAFQKYDNSLASVASSGSYNDLSDRPQLMTDAQARSVVQGIITAHQS